MERGLIGVLFGQRSSRQKGDSSDEAESKKRGSFGIIIRRAGCFGVRSEVAPQEKIPKIGSCLRVAWGPKGGTELSLVKDGLLVKVGGSTRKLGALGGDAGMQKNVEFTVRKKHRRTSKGFRGEWRELYHTRRLLELTKV